MRRAWRRVIGIGALGLIAGPSPTTSATETTTVPSDDTTAYVVQEGDVFAGIAATYCIDVDDLYVLNPALPYPITPGDVINVPTSRCLPVADGAPPTDELLDGTGYQWPSVFPVVEATSVGAVSASGWQQDGAPTEAVVARRRGDSYTDVVVVAASSYTSTAVPTTGAFGQPATVTVFEHTDPPIMTITVGTGPRLTVEGIDPWAFVDAASADAIDLSFLTPGASVPDAIEFGELPSGWEVLSNGPRYESGQATGRALWQSGELECNVFVSTRQSALTLAVYDGLTRVDINGLRGWAVGNNGMVGDVYTYGVSWQIDDQSYAWVQSGGDVDHSLQCAREVSFVGRDQWFAHYAPSPPRSLAEPATSTTGAGIART